MDATSPQSLFAQLVHTVLAQAIGSSHPLHYGQSAEDVARLHRCLRSKVNNTLLGSLPGPLQHRSDVAMVTGGRYSTTERVLMASFKLRQNRRFDEAQQLEVLLEQLDEVKAQGKEQADLIDRLLKFLLALAGTKQHSTHPALGHKKLNLPTIRLKGDAVLPEGAWYHGDGTHVLKHNENRPYINYARGLFEGTDFVQSCDDSGISVSSGDNQLNSKIFQTEPGHDLYGNRLFAVRSIMGNNYERKTRETLFGALVHSHVTDLNATLSLPDLPDSTNPAFLGLKIPHLAESQTSDDEGYHESISGSITSTFSSPEKENIWDAALHFKPSRHRAWENIGNQPRPTERPYVTEAGAAILDQIYEVRCKEAAIVQPSSRTKLLILPDQQRLVQHVWNVLIGLPSDLFICKLDTLTFTVNPQICLTGTTPESFHQLLAEFAQAGTNYMCLWQTSQQPITDSTYTGGLVLQAFLGAVRRYLQYYNAQVLLAQAQVEGCNSTTVLLIRTMFSRLMAQLSYLAKLCGCDSRRGTKPGAPGDPLPMGIHLLSYLYQEALDSTSTDNYRLMLSLLRSSCAPYLMFIQDWVFHGICRDCYGEFMIQANHTYLFYRDKHYWTHGYALMTGEDNNAVPLFLQELSSDIYICGKSINLLKLCAPEHFVCNVTVETPCIGLTFSPAELELVTSRTKTYIKHVEILAGQLTVSRKEKERREEAARVELLAVARRTAAEENQKHIEMVKVKRAVAEAKKRKEFLALKEQMQKDLLRRGQAVEDEKEEDRERMEEVTRREQAALEAESELERKAREDVIQFYEELSKQAAEREQRALWRIRRRQLDSARIEFLQQDKEALRQELAAQMILPSTEEQAVNVDGAETVTGRGKPDDSEQTQISTLSGAVEITSAQAVDDQNIMLSGVVSADNVQQVGFDVQPQAAPNLSESYETKGDEANVGSDNLVGVSIIPSDPQIPTKLDSGADAYQDDDRLEVGDVVNEELEPVLALIRGDEDEVPHDKRSEDNVTGGRTKRGITIDEFLPREQKQKDDEGTHEIDPELPGDTTVDDVLLEIGSSLPHQDVEVDEEIPPHGMPTEGNILDDILGRDESGGTNGGGDRIVGLPHRPQKYGQVSDSSIQQSASADDVTQTLVGLPRRHHKHGHASDSSLQVGRDGTEGVPGSNESIPVIGVPQRSHEHGHVSESSLQRDWSTGDRPATDHGRLEGVPHLSHAYGHVSTLSHDAKEGDTGPSDLDYGGIAALPRRSHTHGHASDSSLQGSTVIQSEEKADGEVGAHKRVNVHGHASDSSLQTGDHSVKGPDLGGVTGLPHRSHIHGHASDSSIQQVMAHSDSKQISEHRTHIHGHASDSTIGTIMEHADLSKAAETTDKDGSKVHSLPRAIHTSSETSLQTLVHEQDQTELDKAGVEGLPQRPHIHGHASDSTLQSVLYPSQTTSDPDRNKVEALSEHGHPSDSTVQKLLYQGKKTVELQREEKLEEVDLPVMVWADQGREVSEFNFNMFEGLPDTDILGRTGYMPLKSEIGDYGVQTSDSDSIEATDLLPLPIIIRRSITAPLKAQVWLVNQSILDYFLVDLKIDKHFVALRRFLFLQDGEFGQALCDQVFDKLAHCVHLQELLSPMTLNQILSRAIQFSASSDSQQADNLSFALKWHPTVFKPNAIDTLDCLELRYLVKWPNNVVITDTCLVKYNKVFSFLLQLKRTAWVLRDIHHQLKISAMIHKASGSAQYHQLQLFRHEMQHFVNVMQGYVVNQVIHVSWEEFQKDLKGNVHSLDDLREKHALYLNKAILRCLLNKKAAPVMKIISDILSLVLKVRTQLTSSPWAWDASSGQVIHPCFRNIKKSYMAFKEYSGFLYKVVAKLVTRGYQPHLEEFMLRLNFNSYYQERKT